MGYITLPLSHDKVQLKFAFLPYHSVSTLTNSEYLCSLLNNYGTKCQVNIEFASPVTDVWQANKSGFLLSIPWFATLA